MSDMNEIIDMNEIDDEIKIIDAFEESELTLRERIEKSQIFVVFATPNYIENLKTRNEKEMIDAKRIAAELHKDSIILIDRRSSEKDIKILEAHTRGLNVIRKEILDLTNTSLVAKILRECNDLL